MSEFSVEADGRGPYPLAMENRVARPEEDMRDVESVLFGLEPMIVRIDATLTSTLPGLATKAEVAGIRTELTKEISGLRTEVAKNFGDFRAEVVKDSAALRAEVAKDFGNFRAEVAAEISGFRTEVAKDSSGLRADLTKEISDLRTEMIARFADVPTKTCLWGILGALITAYGAGLAALAILK
jgi:hypothetical protein